MSDAVQIALIAALPQILLGLAILYGVVRGNMKITGLEGLVNGKLSAMIQAVREASRLEGKVAAMQDAISKPSTTTIIADRRQNQKETP